MPCGELSQPYPHHHHHHHHLHHHPSSSGGSSAFSETAKGSLKPFASLNENINELRQLSSHQQQQQNQNLNLNNLNQMMATTVPGRVVGAGGGGGQKHGSSPAPHSHHHHLTVDVNLNHVMGPAQPLKTPISPNPLDNDNLRRQSTGLSAFNDYVVSGTAGYISCDPRVRCQ